MRVRSRSSGSRPTQSRSGASWSGSQPAIQGSFGSRPHPVLSQRSASIGALLVGEERLKLIVLILVGLPGGVQGPVRGDRADRALGGPGAARSGSNKRM